MSDDTALDDFAHRSLDQVGEILPHYPLTAPVVTFVAHNAGAVYCVDALEGAFMLKLAVRVGEGPNLAADEIEQGMEWLAAMEVRTGLVLQTPVRTGSGPYVCHVGGVSATVQRWIEGRALDGDFTAAQLRSIGHTLARLHADSAAHPTTADAAVRHDIVSLYAAAAIMRQTLVPYVVAPDRFAVLEQAVARIATMLDDLGTESAVWGAVHGDVHQDNVLLVGDDVVLIDWTPVRLAHYWYDLGVTMYHIFYQPPAMRHALLDGYDQGMPVRAVDVRVVEAMLVFAAIDNIAWNCAVPAQRGALFHRNVAQLIDEFCAALVADRRFLLAA